MLEYHYSAFGELFNKSNDYSGLVKELFDNNIYIYKGYCYDFETSLYYCNSRYYNPEWGRWLNADDVSYLDPSSVNGLNLYAYCGNNPVMFADPNGTFVISLTTAIILTFFAVGATAGGVYAYNRAYEAGYRGWELAGWTTLGIVGGGVIGGTVGYFVAPYIASFATSTIGSITIPKVMGDVLGYTAINVTGAAIAIPLALAGTAGLMMFAKGNGPRMGHNQYENQQIDSLCNKYNLNRDQRRILHDHISGQNYLYKQIEQIIIELFFS